jgi:hypothetical protein
MGKARLVSSCLVIGTAIAATVFSCGDDGGGSSNPDAKVFMDAPKVFMDAPPGQGVMGLGQKCGSNLPACPANAPDCIALAVGSGASPTYCTPHCLDNGTGMTDAQGKFISSSFMPAPDPTKCSGAFTGSVGSAACGVLLKYNPMDIPPKAGSAYNMINLGCVVICGSGSACPMGMSCTMTGAGPLCFPQ